MNFESDQHREASVVKMCSKTTRNGAIAMAHWPVLSCVYLSYCISNWGRTQQKYQKQTPTKICYSKDIPKNYSKNIPSWICCRLFKGVHMVGTQFNISDQTSAGVDLLDLLKKGLGDFTFKRCARIA